MIHPLTQTLVGLPNSLDGFGALEPLEPSLSTLLSIFSLLRKEMPLRVIEREKVHRISALDGFK